MSLRLALVGGAVLAAAAMAAGSFVVLTAPARSLEVVRTRLTACGLPGLRCAPPGVFLHQRTIGEPLDAALGLPDPDTLVSSAWVRVGSDPLRIEVPPTGERFFAVQIFDGSDDAVVVASPRTLGRDGGSLRITPAEVRTEWAWIVARFAVDGENDAPAVHALQNTLRISRVQ